MKSDGVKKNFIFQVLYQIIVLIIPLIISPYLTRTLGSNSLGIYSYTYSIAYYFLIFINLGISKHGQRIINARKDDDIALRKTFWSLIFDRFIMSIIVSCCFFVFLFFVASEYKDIYLYQFLFVCSAVFDITWLYYGLENFKKVVFKNLIIKIIECVLIFILIHSPNDLWVYTIIKSGSILLGNLSLVPNAIRTIKPIKFSINDMKEHFKPLLLLFICVLSSSLYTVLDRTLIGQMVENIDSVAFYEYSEKIINIPKSIIAVIGVVLFPKACYFYNKNMFDKQQEYIHYSVILTALLGIGCTFGLLAISSKFVSLYYGDDFSTCGDIIKAMSPLILIITLGDIFRSEYIIPSGKDIVYVISTVISAIINIVLSIVLIPILGIYGAVVGTISAELFGFVFQYFYSRKIYRLKKLCYDFIPFVIPGVLMYLLLAIIDKNVPTSYLWLSLEIVIGLLSYSIFALFIILILHKDLKTRLINVIKKRKKV